MTIRHARIRNFAHRDGFSIGQRQQIIVVGLLKRVVGVGGQYVHIARAG